MVLKYHRSINRRQTTDHHDVRYMSYRVHSSTRALCEYYCLHYDTKTTVVYVGECMLTETRDKEKNDPSDPLGQSDRYEQDIIYLFNILETTSR